MRKKWVTTATNLLLFVLLSSCLCERDEPKIQSCITTTYLPVVTKNYKPPLDKCGICTIRPECWRADIVNATARRHWYWAINDCPNTIDIPCVWGPQYVNNLIQHPEQLIGDSNIVLGFNEPDVPDQANVSPEDAIEPWHRLISAFPDWKFASPATEQGTWWITEFYNLYKAQYPNEIPFQILDFHCYEDNIQACINRTEEFIDLADAWNVPEVWISEFSFGNYDSEGAADRGREFIEYLFTKSKITRFFWFIDELRPDDFYPPDWKSTSLIIPYTTKLTDLGVMYSDICKEYNNEN